MERIQQLAADQGWSDETLGMMALTFLVQQGQETTFLTYLQDVADEENAASLDDTDEDEDFDNDEGSGES